MCRFDFFGHRESNYLLEMDLKERVKELAQEHFAQTKAWRQHLHAHPELSFEEEKTAQFIAEQLKLMGIPFKAGIAGTGIVALIEGNDPSSSMTALRADIDALPIQELNEVAYKSTIDGRMHACGHDVHTSSLLGAAKILNDLKSEIKGSIRLIFQPGEEKLPGGASLLIKEGVLKNPVPKKILGQHVFPELPAGKVGFKSGVYMASADEIYITIKGKGGHAAMPHKNIDPILTAARVICGLQELVSRKSNPAMPTVLSFGAINGGFATNVTPEEVQLLGTFRTFDETWRFEAHEFIKNFVEATCAAVGASALVDIRVGYPCLYNHEETTELKKAQAIEFLGEENVIDLDIRMTAEDFAYYTHEVPGCFYRLGTAAPDGSKSAPVHNPHFDIDEHALETSIGLMAWLAIQA